MIYAYIIQCMKIERGSDLAVKKLSVIVKSKSGLHARPAGLFVKIANQFKSNITIKKGDKVVNGKSIMGILAMGTSAGDELEVIAEGQDEVEVIKEMEVLFNTILIHE